MLRSNPAPVCRALPRQVRKARRQRHQDDRTFRASTWTEGSAAVTEPFLASSDQDVARDLHEAVIPVNHDVASPDSFGSSLFPTLCIDLQPESGSLAIHRVRSCYQFDASASALSVASDFVRNNCLQSLNHFSVDAIESSAANTAASPPNVTYAGSSFRFAIDFSADMSLSDR